MEMTTLGRSLSYQPFVGLAVILRVVLYVYIFICLDT